MAEVLASSWTCSHLLLLIFYSCNFILFVPYCSKSKTTWHIHAYLWRLACLSPGKGGAVLLPPNVANAGEIEGSGFPAFMFRVSDEHGEFMIIFFYCYSIFLALGLLWGGGRGGGNMHLFISASIIPPLPPPPGLFILYPPIVGGWLKIMWGQVRAPALELLFFFFVFPRYIYIYISRVLLYLG